MSSKSVKYICPTTGKTKKKIFSDGVTTLKKKHFEELLQLRTNQEAIRAEIERRKKHISASMEHVDILTVQRANALTELEKEEKNLKSVQDAYATLSKNAKCYQKSLKSVDSALTDERAKTSKLAQKNALLTTQYNKMKADLEEQKRKNLEREKQLAEEQKQQDLAISGLMKQIDSYNKRGMQKKSPTVKFEDEQKTTRLRGSSMEPQFYSRRDEKPKVYHLRDDKPKPAPKSKVGWTPLKEALKSQTDGQLVEDDLFPRRHEQPKPSRFTGRLREEVHSRRDEESKVTRLREEKPKSKVDSPPLKEALNSQTDGRLNEDKSSPKFCKWNDWKEALRAAKNADRLDGVPQTQYWNGNFTY